MLTALSLSSLFLVSTDCAGGAWAQSQLVQPSPDPSPYGQAAGAALDQPVGQYGQPAGAALDQASGPYGQPAGNALDIPSTTQNGQPTNSQFGRIQPAPLQQGQPNVVPPNPGATGNLGTPPNMNGPATMGETLGSPSAGQAAPFDVGSLKVSRLELDLQNAEFMTASVEALHVIATDLDVKNGALSGLSIATKGGSFSDVAFDQLTIMSQGNLSFDRALFLNNKTLQFNTPATAQVTAVVSQDSLNRFLNSPRTLQRLSVNAASKMHFLAGMLGSNANIGVNLSDASVLLQKGNRVVLGVNAQIGMGKVGVPLPLSVQTKLGLNDQGWVALSDTHLNANGQEISPLLSSMLVKKFNDLADWSKVSPDIKFNFSDLKVVPNRQFMVKGTAQIARLRFGHPAM
jgi:hypothetical protein